MKRSHKVVAGIAAGLGLALASAAFAHPEGMQGMQGMQHGMMGGMSHAGMGKTPEERQKLADANRAKMQKRAKEKGITLPEPHSH